MIASLGGDVKTMAFSPMSSHINSRSGRHRSLSNIWKGWGSSSSGWGSRNDISARITSLHLRISLPYSAKQEREMIKLKVLWRMWTHDGEFSLLYLNLNTVPINSVPRYFTQMQTRSKMASWLSNLSTMKTARADESKARCACARHLPAHHMNALRSWLLTALNCI